MTNNFSLYRADNGSDTRSVNDFRQTVLFRGKYRVIHLRVVQIQFCRRFSIGQGSHWTHYEAVL
jgi:hypothetical protein